MADFDPYYQWLAIPPKDQPPNHYRLLGVDLFESNTDAIANAADQRMTHLRSFQTGKYAEFSQKLLNEITAAKLCLLNAEKKTAYDRQLRQQVAAPPAPPPAPRADRPPFLDTPAIAAAAVPAVTAKPEKSSDKQQIWIGLGVLAAAVLVLVIVLIVKLGRGGKEIASNESKPSSSAATPAESKSVDAEPPEDLQEPVKQAEPRTAPPDNRPKEAVRLIPAADLGKPGDASPPKPADSATSTAATPRPQPESPPKDSANEVKKPPGKEVVPAAEKPKATAAEERPKEKSGTTDTAAGSKEKPQKPAAPAEAKVKSQKPAALAPPREKLAVPDEATLKRALATIRESFKVGYLASEKAALAQTLLEKADESKSDATARFALLQVAKKLAADAGQGELAFEIIDVMASEYQIPAAAMKAEIVEQAAKKIRPLQQRKEIAAAALAVMDEAIAEDDFDAARRMGKQAGPMVRASKDRELTLEIVAKNKEVEAAAKACADAKAARFSAAGEPERS